MQFQNFNLNFQLYDVRLYSW